jgi:hypothetical protein
LSYCVVRPPGPGIPIGEGAEFVIQERGKVFDRTGHAI